jgi:hypothetical protein
MGHVIGLRQIDAFVGQVEWLVRVQYAECPLVKHNVGENGVVIDDADTTAHRSVAQPSRDLVVGEQNQLNLR